MRLCYCLLDEEDSAVGVSLDCHDIDEFCNHVESMLLA